MVGFAQPLVGKCSLNICICHKSTTRVFAFTECTGIYFKIRGQNKNYWCYFLLKCIVLSSCTILFYEKDLMIFFQVNLFIEGAFFFDGRNLFQVTVKICLGPKAIAVLVGIF